MHERNPMSVVAATSAGRSPRRRSTLATGSRARPSSIATAAASTRTHSAVSSCSTAQPTMPDADQLPGVGRPRGGHDRVDGRVRHVAGPGAARRAGPVGSACRADPHLQAVGI